MAKVKQLTRIVQHGDPLYRLGPQGIGHISFEGRQQDRGLPVTVAEVELPLALLLTIGKESRMSAVRRPRYFVLGGVASGRCGDASGDTRGVATRHAVDGSVARSLLS
jgi:hypothetical protein